MHLSLSQQKRCQLIGINLPKIDYDFEFIQAGKASEIQTQRSSAVSAPAAKEATIK